jgi:spermidine/putrescine transport system substrate-binding protein
VIARLARKGLGSAKPRACAGLLATLGIALVLLPGASAAAGGRLRLLTWSDYAPPDVIAQFERETGIKVELTLSNNEEMIAKLRATGGAGYDIVQPSIDRIAGAQREYGIYRPIDLSRVDAAAIDPDLLATARANTTVDGKLFGLPFLWGTDGLVADIKKAPVADYLDICDARFQGRTSARLRRPILIEFAFAMGRDPFALYADPAKYAQLMDEVGARLASCKKNVRFFFDNKDQLLNALRSGEVVAAVMWDTGGWKLNLDFPDIRYIPPRSGALGWIDTFALPAKGRNDEAAYAWINFNLRPQIAARVAAAVGDFSSVKAAEPLMPARMREQYAQSFPPAVRRAIHWYPAIPPGIEEIDGRVLDRIRAAD